MMFKRFNKIYNFLNVDGAEVGDEVFYFSKGGKKLKGKVVRTSVQTRDTLPLRLNNYLPAYLVG